MNLSIKELLIYGVCGLTAAVLINNVAELDVPFLNKIERAIVPESERGLKGGAKHFDYTSSDGASAELNPECARFKTKGDAKTILRKQLRDARSSGDEYAIEELEQKLEEIENEEREACR